MSLNLGNTNIGSLYLGSTKIGSAYLGSTKVYQSSSGPVPPSDEVQIGNQIWKTKNLAIDDGQGGIYTYTVNYGQGDVVEYYYTWDAANRVANSISGWHLPTTNEWSTLSTTVGGVGNTLKSTYGWDNDGNGTDDYGFTALPAGYTTNGSVFNNLWVTAYFWTANSRTSTTAYSRSIGQAGSIGSRTQSKTYGYSVRLVKDAT